MTDLYIQKKIWPHDFKSVVYTSGGKRAPVGSKKSIANDIHLVAGAAVELLLVLVQVWDLKFSSTLVAFEAVLLENSRKLHL